MNGKKNDINMNQLDLDYQALLKDILENGVEKKDRTGTGTLSVFGRQIRHKFKDGKFPLLTTKKMYFKGIVTELLWFLRGDTNIKYLVDNGCHIWDGDCYANYQKKAYQEEYNKISNNGMFEVDLDWQPLSKEEFIERIKTDSEFAAKWGSLGSIYGAQWRAWNNYIGHEIAPNGFEMWNEPIDQISELINQLKNNPDSRRMVVSAWAVHDLLNMVLPPCHYGFQVYTRELSLKERCEYKSKKDNVRNTFEQAIDSFGVREVTQWIDEDNVPTRAISLMWNQRSVDTFLGLPFNIASYALFLEIIAKEVNMIPDELIGTLGDVHLYTNHIDQAKEQINREPMELPTLMLCNDLSIENFIPSIDEIDIKHIKLINYQSHPAIKAPLSN